MHSAIDFVPVQVRELSGDGVQWRGIGPGIDFSIDHVDQSGVPAKLTRSFGVSLSSHGLDVREYCQSNPTMISSCLMNREGRPGTQPTQAHDDSAPISRHVLFDWVRHEARSISPPRTSSSDADAVVGFDRSPITWMIYMRRSTCFMLLLIVLASSRTCKWISGTCCARSATRLVPGMCPSWRNATDAKRRRRNASARYLGFDGEELLQLSSKWY